MRKRSIEHADIRRCIGAQSHIIAAEIDLFANACGIGPIQIKRYGQIVYRLDNSILFLYKGAPQLVIHTPEMDDRNRIEQACTRLYDRID